MDSAAIRSLVIQALFADDELMSQLVIKGGTALELIHRVVDRGSLDIDLSIRTEFTDLEGTEARLVRAVGDRFDANDLVVFDTRFSVLPPLDPNRDPTPWWGGYAFEFKVIPRQKWEELGRNAVSARKYAEVVGRAGSMKFRVEISKHEFCGGAHEVEFEGFTVFVYSPEMSALEKVRAICQQMEAYPIIPKEKKRARARDFYDIHALVEKRGVDFSLPGNHETCRQIFAAKRVPLALIAEVERQRDFHYADWPRVVDAIVGTPEEFDFYFDFVVSEVTKLEPLWVE